MEGEGPGAWGCGEPLRGHPYLPGWGTEAGKCPQGAWGCPRSEAQGRDRESRPQDGARTNCKGSTVADTAVCEGAKPQRDTPTRARGAGRPDLPLPASDLRRPI